MADKAFLSGINDYKTIGDLRGCVNDTVTIRRLLVDEFGFDEGNIRVKKDSEVTKPALNKGWKWLLRNAKRGDRLVFHFSGHGSYTADTDGEDGEADFRDELLCLYGMDWSDPKTYMLDDELAEWTKQIPEGVHVTFLLDCCHSGTGTRFIQPELSRAVKSDFASAASLSIEDVAVRRANDGKKTLSRAARTEVKPAAQSDIGRQTVLARYAPPPVEVQVAIKNAKKSRSFRDLLRATQTRDGSGTAMNHVLWSGCQDNQTSADAYIGGDYHGAFTYYFDQATRAASGTRKSNVVIKSLRTTLDDEGFSQVPQLEPNSTDGDVFGGVGGSNGDGNDQDLCEGGLVSSDDWAQLIGIMQQIADHLGVSRGGAMGNVGGVRAGSRSLVYIHGICEHKPTYSDAWFDAMSPHLSTSVRNALDANREEVLWSEHVSKMNRSFDSELDPVEMRDMESMLEAILAERMVREASEQFTERNLTRGEGDLPPGSMPRAMFGIPGLDCVDDFVKYLSSDRIRKLVIGEATDVLRPRLKRGESIELISHSWGTVVAYEALHALEREGLSGRVHNWFTVGAALAIGFVAKRLRPSDGRKPLVVDHWVNLDARGDGVGGSIRATGMHVDEEFLRLAPFGCESTFGLVSPACAHSSYFKAGNARVNRDIFAKLIERT